jgi:choline transport protein
MQLTQAEAYNTTTMEDLSRPKSRKESMAEARQDAIESVVAGVSVNASGHPDQLTRQYSIWSICGLALTIDNAWVALGGSIVVAVGTNTRTE